MAKLPRSPFQLLQLFKKSGDVRPVYYVFDLLFLEGKDLCQQPLSARRKLLAQVLEKAPENTRLSGELRGTKDKLLRVAQEFGLEGLVGKRKTSVYESGRRTGAWVKFEISQSQEFVIGGYTLPEGGRKYFGSVLVCYQSPEGLIFAGRWLGLSQPVGGAEQPGQVVKACCHAGMLRAKALFINGVAVSLASR